MAHGFFKHGAAGGVVGEGFEPKRAIYPGLIKKVAIVGHSYVRKLYIDKSIYHPHYTIKSLAAPGAKVSTLRSTEAWDHLVSWRPDLSYLVIGGNDIRSGIVPKELANQIQELARDIESQTGGHCYIIGLSLVFLIKPN